MNLRNILKQPCQTFNPLTANVPKSANQLTGFYMMGTLAVKRLRWSVAKIIVGL